MNPASRLRVARSHRLLGMIATVPLVGWIASSFVLHGVGLALPNGLQGVYELEPYHGVELRLEEVAADGEIVPPGRVLEALATEGLERFYWLRLELLGGVPAYVVKPGPFELERVYDARTAARLDPLPEEVLRRIGDGALVETRVAELHPGDEFNRYYTMDRVPAVALEMEGAQPSEVVLSRASGRTLRRTDPGAAAFEKAYRSVHVWQWGDALRFFTALLYTLVGLTLTLVVLGYTMWFDRRERRKRWTDAVRRERRIHAGLAPIAGVILATQMLVGAYLWFNLGLIEPRFRGQGSFAAEWSGGIAVTEQLADAAEIAAALPGEASRSARPIQRYEWRAVGDRRFWIAYPERNADGMLIDAATGEALERLTPELAAEAGAMVVEGVAAGPPRESTEYWMDYNARVPTYLFRFTDPDDTDVHVNQVTGEVVQRRPAIWRAFGPFLAYHTFAFSGNPWLDTLLLTLLQLTVLGMLWTGWRMIRRGGVSAMLVLLVPAALAGQTGERQPGTFQAGLQVGRLSHSLLGTADGMLTRPSQEDLELDVDIRAESSVTLGGLLGRDLTPRVAVRVRVARTTTHMRIEALARPLTGPGVQTFEFDGLGDVGLWLAGADVVWTLLDAPAGPRPYLIGGLGASRWTITGLDDLDFPPLLESPVNFDPVETTLPAVTLGGGVAVPLGGRGSLVLEVTDFVSGNPFEDDDFRIGTSFQGLGKAEDLVHSLTLSGGLRLSF